MGFLNVMEIRKIEKPQDGWTEEYLKKFDFSFSYGGIFTYKKTVLFLLNKHLEYFYYIEECAHIHYIFIKNEYIDLLNSASKHNQFDYNILIKIINFYDYDSYDEIQQKLKNIKQIQTYNLRQEHLAQSKRFERSKQRRIEQQERKQYFKQKDEEQQEIRHKEYSGGDGCIYAIYSQDWNYEKTLLYIGLTERELDIRWKEHLDYMADETKRPFGMSKLYNLLIKEKDKKGTLICKSLLQFSEIKTNKILTRQDKEAIECAFISYYRPIGNTAGIDIPYLFSNKEQ